MKQTLLRWGRTLALLSIPLWGQAGILPGPLVETRWLADNAQAVQIVEVRADAKSFLSAPEVTVDKKGKKTIEEIGGHIPGSVLANPKNMRVDRMIGGLKVQYMIPEAPDFEKYLRQSGLVAGKPIVLVPIGQDLSDINDTLRLYWQLKVYGEDEVADGSERSCSGTDTATVLVHRRVAAPMQLVLDAPVTAGQREQAVGSGLGRRERGHEVGDFGARLVFDLPDTLDAEHLGSARPAEMRHDFGARHRRALLDATVDRKSTRLNSSH